MTRGADAAVLGRDFTDALNEWIVVSNRSDGVAGGFSVEATDVVRYALYEGTRLELQIRDGDIVTTGDVLKLSIAQVRAMKGVGVKGIEMLEAYLRAKGYRLSCGWPHNKDNKAR